MNTAKYTAWILFLTMVALAISCTQTAPAPKLVESNEWPPAMRDLLDRYPALSESITTYKHNAFVDSKFTWKIENQSEQVTKMIVDLELESATIDHVKFKELQRCLPKSWTLPDLRDAQVYVSKGYGVEHQEGVDLLLVVRNTRGNNSFVLYQWIF